MSQFLPRGCHISSDNRIRKLVASGCDWQIYLTNLDTYVLAVKMSLYEKWVSKFALPEGIFLEEPIDNYKVFLSSNDYLVSSMDKGPYPDDNGQIEAFSIAFKTVTGLFPGIAIQDAIYIEEYSLILPVSFDSNLVDKGTVYGKWLTGGINVSIDSFERVNKIMSWLPAGALKKSAELAGFTVAVPDIPIDSEEKTIEFVDTLEGKENLNLPENKSFSLIGRPDLEQFFNDNIIDIILHQEEYKKMGISFPGATILYGPPGCGKTYAVEKLSEYLGWRRFDIDSSTIASSYIHDTSKKISEVFRNAIKAAPSILVIDEMEAFLSDRSIAGPSGTHHVEEVAEFLRRIPEAISKGVLVFAMTNMIDAIDPAILRRGRFDHIVEVKMACAEEIAVLLKSRFNELPVDDTVDAELISKALDGHPMSDVTFVLREAGRYAVKRKLDNINCECFNDAINLLPKKTERNKIGFVNT